MKEEIAEDFVVIIIVFVLFILVVFVTILQWLMLRKKAKVFAAHSAKYSRQR